MKKIINNPKDVVSEFLNGFTNANSHIVKRIANFDIIITNDVPQNQVNLISGGGSGHEPSHAGYVGSGMLTAAVCGAMFTSPTPDQILEAIKQSNNGLGVLLIVKNYTGDLLNFEIAKELAADLNISVEYILVNDDIAVIDSTWTLGRRGVAGTILVHKILGGLAKNGLSLQQLKEVGTKLVKNIKTIGVALSGATLPEVGKPGFELKDNEIEYGVGIHGEPGYRRQRLVSSKELAKELVGKLDLEFKFKSNENYGILVNGLGSTPLMEQYIFLNDVIKLLSNYKVNILFNKVGNYMTAIDMAGISLTLIKLQDNWLKMLNEEVNVVSW